MIVDILKDTLVDVLKMISFLLAAYLILEYLEHKTDEKTVKMIQKSGKIGPLVGGVLGLLPQCGFSIAAANFYAGRVITAGTLIAVFLATSDEMLPILLSERMPIAEIGRILLIKMLVGVIVGFLVDLVLRRTRGGKSVAMDIEGLCEQEHCHCETGILKPAVFHTFRTLLFIAGITLVLNAIMATVGEAGLTGLVTNQPVVGELTSALIGLIPNCGSSIVITQLYVKGAMGFGAMMAGLLVNAGLGILVLCRMNRHPKENLAIIGVLYLIGVVVGIGLNIGNIS